VGGVGLIDDPGFPGGELVRRPEDGSQLTHATILFILLRALTNDEEFKSQVCLSTLERCLFLGNGPLLSVGWHGTYFGPTWTLVPVLALGSFFAVAACVALLNVRTANRLLVGSSAFTLNRLTQRLIRLATLLLPNSCFGILRIVCISFK